MASKGFSQWGNDLYTGRKSYNIVGKSGRWFVIAAVLVIASIGVIFLKGINLGLDFRGGTEFELTGIGSQSEFVAVDAVRSVAPEQAPRTARIAGTGLRVQTEALDQGTANEVRAALADAYGIDQSDVTFGTIGATWGEDVANKAVQGAIVFLILVTAVMSIYFRAWRMAVAALIALLHDLVVTVGIYALIGWEVTPATVIGLLTILGYSVYDTVVVFDKVKENTSEILDQSMTTYGEQANLAVNQTLVRSINTSMVSLLPIGSILFIGAFVFGAGTLRDISLALFVGIAVGAFSSVFIAPPLEVVMRRGQKSIQDHTKRVLELRAGAAGDDESAVLVESNVGSRQLQPGHHRGNAAQPKRKSKKR